MIGDFVEFRIMLAERLGYFHFLLLEDTDELERVNDGFALEMVVGDDERALGVVADLVDARDPRLELLPRVEIVVALVRWNILVVGKPGIVAAAVQTDVAEGRSRLRRRSLARAPPARHRG